MARRNRRSRGTPLAARERTPPSISDQLVARSDRGKLFADDGRKLRDSEHVGAKAPDTDPPDAGPPAPPAPRRRSPRPTG